MENREGGAFSVYLKKGSLDAIPVAQKNWLIDHAPEKWDELVQKQNRDRDRARRILRGDHNEGETASERRALVKFESDMVENPDRFADMSPEEFDSAYGVKLSPSGYKKAGSLFAGSKKGDRVNDAAFGKYVNEQVRTNPMMIIRGHDSKSTKANKKALADGYRADFGEAKRAFKEEKKRDPSMAEVHSTEFQKEIYKNLLRRSGVHEVDQPEETPPIPEKAEEFGLDVKPSLAERTAQLKKLGKSKAEGLAIIKAEGY